MEWVIPCNEKLYNHRGAFENLSYIDWRQSTNVKKGDVVYIYVGASTSSILYKCYVKEADMDEADDNDIRYNLTDKPAETIGRFMRLVLICRYPKGLFHKDVILKNGLNTVQGPSKVSEELRNYILAHETDQVLSSTDILKGKGILNCTFRRKDGDIEKHECEIDFPIINHRMWSEIDDSIYIGLVKATATKLDEYNEPNDFVEGNIYYKEKCKQSDFRLSIRRENNEWVFSKREIVSCMEITQFYSDGRKEVQLHKR